MVCTKGIDRIHHATVIASLLLAASALTMGCPFDTSGKGSLTEPTLCSDAAECDAGNPCVGEDCATCDTPAQCPGTDDDCKTRTCVDHHCGFSYEGAGTPAPPGEQIPGDCQQLQCDGIGGIRSLADDTDLNDDGNDCTTDTCNAGAPQHIASPGGAMCAQGQGSCDSGGQCKLVDGQGCSADNECASTFCVDSTCCNGVCDNTCWGCDVAGHLGACHSLPVFTDDNNSAPQCNGDHTCSASGGCRLKSGLSCSTNSECASGDCDNDSTCSE